MAAELRFTAEAESDAAEAYEWYEGRSVGLGEQFLLLLEAQLEAIARQPLLYPQVYQEFRRALLRRFPYAVFFDYTGDEVVIVAVFHTARDPRKWRQRVS